MSHGQSDAEILGQTHNVARFFTHHRQVAWVLLLATTAWGIFAYYQMPKRKDPVFPSRTAVVLGVWPGVSAEKIEALVTRRIEQKISENPTATKITSIVRTSVTVVYFDVDERIADTSSQFDDVKLRLDGITDLPEGVQPLVFLKDFAETAALMLTVSSPPVSGPELDIKARDVAAGITAIRAGRPGARASVVVAFPPALAPSVVESPARLLAAYLSDEGVGHDVRVLMGQGFVIIDGEFPPEDRVVLEAVRRFIGDRLQRAEFHPDVWEPTIVRAPEDARARLASVAGNKYHLPRSRPVHRPDSESRPDHPRHVARRTVRHPETADLPRLLPAAPGRLRAATLRAACPARVAQHRVPRRHPRDRPEERHHRSLGRVRLGERDRRRALAADARRPPGPPPRRRRHQP